MRRLVAAIRNRSLFQKLFLAFVLILVVPISISWYVSQSSTTEVVVRRVFQETQDSLELVGSQVEDVLQRMIYVALYLNNDENLKTLLIGDVARDTGGSPEERLAMWTRVSTITKMFDNVSFNVMRAKCYLTIVSPAGRVYTNWSTRNTDMKDLRIEAPVDETDGTGMYVHWVGVQRNPISAEAAAYPFVITLTKRLIGRQGIAPYGTLAVSVPASEISSLMSRGARARSWFMVDRDLRVMAGSEPTALGTRVLPESAGLLAADPGGHVVTDEPGRDRTLVTWRRMRNNEWTLLTMESFASIAPDLGAIRMRLLVVNVAAALAFIAVAALIVRSITRPIHVLSASMRNLEVELSRRGRTTVHRRDEIGQLQRSYESMRRTVRRLVREVAQKEKRKREAELEALQLQISPHFLFNTLSSIRWAILNGNSGKAAEMIFALGNLLRMSLLKTNAFITVDQEVENLTRYVDLIRLRSDSTFELRVAVDEGIGRDLIPRLLLQPIVENAVIHGLDGGRAGGIIEVEARREARNLVFTVRDNGKGMGSSGPGGLSRTAKLSGVGIRNVDERIKLIYGTSFGLHQESAPGQGTTVTVQVPAAAEGTRA